MYRYEIKVCNERGKYYDENAYRDIITYILNPDKVPAGGVYYHGVSSVETAAEEMQELAAFYGKDRRVRVRHVVVSFPPMTDISLDEAYRIMAEICEYYAPDHQLVAAIHTNKDHLHFHLVLNMVRSSDGKRYSGKKQDYYRFDHQVRKVMRKHMLI